MNMVGKGRLAAGMILAVIAAASLASWATAERQPADAGRALVAAGDCKNARTPVRELSTGAVRSTLLCLVNDERRRHARKPFTRSTALQSAAQRHAEKMAETECLSHQCPGEGSLASRIRRSGYPEGADHWEFAENTGCGLTVEAMVKNWLASRYHRINTLESKFEDLGVGYSKGRVEDRCKASYGTFAAVFAMRRPD